MVYLRTFVILILFAALPSSINSGMKASAQQPEKAAAQKFDEYGPLHAECDEGARLDNFAIALRKVPDAEGVIMVYLGRDTLPAKFRGFLERPSYYLVEVRGIAAGRLKVVNAGYREKQMTELWIVPEGAAAPSPSDTVEVKRERGKAYQYDHMGFGVDISASRPPDETAGAGDADGATEAESDAAAESANEPEETMLAVETKRIVNPAEAGEPPFEETTTVSLWWDADGYVEALKSEKDARACLIYYNDAEEADAEKVRDIVAQAKANLQEKYGLKAESIVTIDGGYCERAGVELWVVPKDSALPQPKVYTKKKRTPEAEEAGAQVEELRM